MSRQVVAFAETTPTHQYIFFLKRIFPRSNLSLLALVWIFQALAGWGIVIRLLIFVTDHKPATMSAPLSMPQTSRVVTVLRRIHLGFHHIWILNLATLSVSDVTIVRMNALIRVMLLLLGWMPWSVFITFSELLISNRSQWKMLDLGAT
jgi:hypothetical protein